MHTLLFALVLSTSAAAQPPTSVSGTVVDSSGLPVSGATVHLESSSGIPLDQVETAEDGRFELAAIGATRVVATASGFAQAVRELPAGAGDLALVLEPAPFFEEVNVTSTRADVPRVDPAGTVTVFTSQQLLTGGAATLDDALRAVPGFTLFRRSSSRVSNPTAQGLMLRGVGGSGASRALVLGDGVPLNDAFGGWVYWDKIPQASIDRVEVLRGSASDLYGADAVGGVVQILTRRPTRNSALALLEGGSMETGRASVFVGGRSDAWSYSGAGEWFNTDGYVLVSEEQDPGLALPGLVDIEAGSDHQSATGSLGYQAANGWRAEGRGTLFWEDRRNGTPLQVNDTASQHGSGQISGGVGGGLLAVQVFGGTQDYYQTFSAPADDRNTERLVREQDVPTKTVGLGGQWTGQVGGSSLLFGAEGRFIDGATIETGYTFAGAPLPQTRAGGSQRVASAFAQATFDLDERLTIVLGAHGDGWHSEAEDGGGARTLGSFNPRVSAAYGLGDTGASLRGSVYQGFRPPTLNELYRGFRVGNVVTTPNSELEPERLTGVEGGIVFSRGLVSLRAVAFWNELDDAITNVTRSATPALITRQRDNAGAVRAAGTEFEVDARVAPALTLSTSAGFTSSRFKGDSELRDNRVPQIADYTLAVTARYQLEGWTASGQVRVTGPQYDDDQNEFLLRRATVFDLFVGRQVRRTTMIFVAVENLFDSEYDVGRNPTLTVGLPRAVRVGVQLNVP